MDAQKRKSSIPVYYAATAKPRPLVDLNTKEKIHFLASFDYVMADCEGVLWQFSNPVPNAGAAVMKLKEAGKKFKIVTNDSQHTDGDYEGLLANIGITELKYDDLVYPPKTMVRYLNKFNKQNSPVFSICSVNANEYFKNMGVNLLTLESILKANHYDETVLSLTSANLQKVLTPQDKINFVLMDQNYNLTYAHIAAAQQYLFNQNCILLVGASETYNQISQDFSTIGTVGVINILQEHRDKEAIVMGKPGSVLADELVDQFRIVDPRRVLFVGGSMLNDIQFANKAGFQTLFVLTGSSKDENLADIPHELKPDFIADSLGDFVRIFEELHV